MNMKNSMSLEDYNKIYIFGAPGSGKTTLTKKISKQLGYPSFATDDIKWNDAIWQKRPEEERTNVLNKILVENKTWIIEGTQWQDWTNPIWEECDIAILCNPSTMKRVYYILKRYFMRQDHVSRPFFRALHNVFHNINYTMQFNKHVLPKLKAKAEIHKKSIVIFS